MEIRELLQRDLDRKIEEVIQVDQMDEQTVHTEITEYVATTRIQGEYERLLHAIAEAPSDPDDRVGVWISGFFGSGKSSFAKNLGYVLANPLVLGQPPAELFKQEAGNAKISALIDTINARMATQVVMFDVTKDRSQAGQGGLSISPYMYRVLLRTLGYAEDFDIAELEISLEREGRLPVFMERFNQQYAEGDAKSVQAWTRRGRTGTEVWNRTGATLHALDPHTYPSPESFARTLVEKRVEVTPRLLVERAFELMHARRPGQALVFIIDEIGQYVAYSQDRLEDLRAVVEEFGKESKNRVKARHAPAPVWCIVTSQEKLDEVTDAMGDNRRILLAKVQDRFHYGIDLSPADIREVATRRVLSKKGDALPVLQQLYQQHQGQLHIATRLERTARRSTVEAEDFVAFYPYLPHYIDLSIDIMSGIRLQPGATRHIGGSNRTIISQVYQMLVNPRTAFAVREVGALVSLDYLYELIETPLGSARQKDIGDIADRFKDDSEDQGWASRVAKVICLLEYVRDLPRTPANIAALLVDRVGRPAPLAEVGTALERLVRAQFVRDTEEGFKLQTAQEKSWDTERRGYRDLRPRDRKEIVRELVADVLAEEKIRDFRYHNRNFRVGLTVDGARMGEEGRLALTVLVAEAPENQSARADEATRESREPVRQNDLYWVFALDAVIDDLVESLHASRQMTQKYDALRAQAKISNEESTSLSGEKREQDLIKSRLKERLLAAIAQGQGVFRGVKTDGTTLGKNAALIFRMYFEQAMPHLYPNLEMGTRPVKGKGEECEAVLKAANLSALPQVFYGGDQGLNLVVSEGGKQAPNLAADTARAVLEYLKREHAYGNKVTGKMLEAHFGGIGYGWDLDIVQIVLAVLLRAGAIEVIYQGRRFRNHLDPQCRVAFTNNPAFRNASFAPRESIGIQTLAAAARAFEMLTGEEVDVEEGAIAVAFKKLAEEELRSLLPVVAAVNANGLPATDVLREYHQTLDEVLAAASDDCVRTLAGEGQSLKETRARVRHIREAVSEANLAVVRQARTVLEQVWPVLAPRAEGLALVTPAEELRDLLASADFYAHLPAIRSRATTISAVYRDLYQQLHNRRTDQFNKALEEVLGRPEWAVLMKEVRDALLAPLTSRACPEEQPLKEGTTCFRCRATLGEMESDLAALSGLKVQVLARLQEWTMPAGSDVRMERVRVVDFFIAPLDETAINAGLERLRDHLYKLVAEGVQIILE